MTLSDVAGLTLLSWDTVKTITKTHLAKDYGTPVLRGVRYLGIDEIRNCSGRFGGLRQERAAVESAAEVFEDG